MAFLLLAVAAGPHMLAAVTTDKSYLVVVIIVLFVIGVFLNFSGVRQLRLIIQAAGRRNPGSRPR